MAQVHRSQLGAPNPRIQRTPSAPPSRKPLGALKPRCLSIALMMAAFGASHLWADKQLPPPGKITVCSTDGAFCAIADPTGPSLSVFRRGATAAVWSLPAWHRQFFLSNDGDHLVIGPEGLSLLPLETRLSDRLLIFMKREAVVRVVTVGDLFPDLSLLRRTASHLEWGRVVGISPRGQLVVELVGGRRVAYGVRTGLKEAER